jgi:hypothetical protein
MRRGEGVRGRWILRHGAWFLAGVVLVIGLEVSRFQVEEPLAIGLQSRHQEPEATEESPQTEPCLALVVLSERASALTGTLALVEREERLAQAEQAAEEIRGLAAEAAGIVGGGELAGVLEDLAASLEKYAGGNPAGANGVQAASACSAEMREQCP